VPLPPRQVYAFSMQDGLIKKYDEEMQRNVVKRCRTGLTFAISMGVSLFITLEVNPDDL
jgi:hypothetical protein